MNQLYAAYQDKLPEGLTEYAGENRLADGFLTLCAPEEYGELLAEGYAGRDALCFGTTAFGDLIVWEKGKYVKLVSFSRHEVRVLESGFDFFFEDIQDKDFLKECFAYSLYLEARERLGAAGYGQCYAASPIPAVGGQPSVENLSIAKTLEYNAVSIALAGKL